MNPNLQSRAEQEVADRRFWRAKELLRSAFPQDFDPNYCEAYGRVLLQMNDLYEAGRYLFVSGARKPEYEPAIQVFIDRFLMLRTRGRYSVLPGRIHNVPIADWPPAMLEDLRGLSTLEDIEQYHDLHSPNLVTRRLIDWLAPCGCFASLGLILLLALIGLLSMLSMLLGGPLF